jgi:hypothetical protein
MNIPVTVGRLCQKLGMSRQNYYQERREPVLGEYCCEYAGGWLYDSTTTSLGYNISANARTGGALSRTGNEDSTTLPLFMSPVTFRPIKDRSAVNKLSDPLSENYPVTDFYGAPILPGGAAGAVQTPTQNMMYLSYGLNDPARGTISSVNPLPDADGFYASGTTVTLIASETGIPNMAFSQWTVDGKRVGGPSLNITMDAHKTVLALFGRVVSDSGDTAGTADAPSLRYVLNNAVNNEVLTLPAGATITLTEPLPTITQNVIIDGNGATLTQTGFAESDISQLLYITAGTVSISRLHFTGGRATTYGAAIRNLGDLTLESCIFSDNQTSSPYGSYGGAIHSTIVGNNGSLTVRGCTFYNNKTSEYGYGGAIFRSGGPVDLTGNLFVQNAAYFSPVFYSSITAGIATSYNVSDKVAGSSMAGDTGGLFSVEDIAFATGGDPTTKPSSGSNLKTLTTLPEGFPRVYFDGTPRTEPATAGAMPAD